MKPKARPRAQNQMDRARELAGKAIDKLADAGAAGEEKTVRKLLKRPSKVRVDRVARSKSK